MAMPVPGPDGAKPSGGGIDPKQMLLGVGQMLDKLVQIFSKAQGLPPEDLDDLSNIAKQYSEFVDRFMNGGESPNKEAPSPAGQPVPMESRGKPGIVQRPF